MSRTIKPKRGHPKAKRLKFRKHEGTPAPQLPYFTAADYRRERIKIDWLWPDVIPKGYVTMLFGPPGVGKSALLAGFCAAVTKCDPWPDGKARREIPGCVVWVETEGNHSWNDLRFEGTQIPADRVIYPRPNRGEFRLDSEADIQSLRETVALTKPDLVIVDSLAGGLPEGDHTKAARRAFRNLRALATAFRVPVLVVQHARKMPTATRRRDYQLDDIRGSSELSFFARSVLGLDQPDPWGDPDHLRIRHLKSNFSAKQPPFGMRIDNHRPVFSSEPPAPPGAPTAMSQAMELLPEWLSAGPKPSTWIEQACRTAGVSFDTCKKAKTLLNIQSEKRNGKWYWKLPTP